MTLARRFAGKLTFPLLSFDSKASHHHHHAHHLIKFNCNLYRGQQYRPYASASSRELPEGGLSSKFLKYKKWFGFGLFGLTLSIVAYRRRKKDDTDPRLPGARKLPRPLGRMKMITYKGFNIPEEVIPTVKALKDFQFREDDVVITSFPKTGVTWLQEIVWLIANDLNFDQALTSSLQDRFPFLEWPLPGIPAIKAMNERRFIKTHLPPTILFKPLEEGSPNPSEVKPKVISIIRNPKDTAISYFCFARMNRLIDFKDIFDDFLLFFIFGQVPYGPIWEHYLDLLHLQKKFEKESDKQSDQRVLIIQYEDLHFHFQREIDKLCDFLGKPRLDAEKMKALQDHCSFQLMSVNRMVNYEHWDELGLRNPDESRFFRSGKVGDWQEYIDKQQEDRMNKWIIADFGGLFEFKYGDESLVD